MTDRPEKHDKEYGLPVAGSKTEVRGKHAGLHISGEVVYLCEMIEKISQRQSDGTVTVTFGRLFNRYTTISNKAVGMVMRARKQELLNFEGEMLWQRRDDDEIITLHHMPERTTATDPDEYWDLKMK